jgi:hypothetical protein
MAYTIIPGRDRALCCECGTARTCTTNHNRLRGLQGERMYTPEELAELRARTEARKGAEYAKRVWGSARPWERSTCDLKCASCGTVTRHAVLRDNAPDDWRNGAELRDHGWEQRYLSAREGSRWVQVRPTAPGLGEQPPRTPQPTLGEVSSDELMRALLGRMLGRLEDVEKESRRSVRRRRPRERRLTRP